MDVSNETELFSTELYDTNYDQYKLVKEQIKSCKDLSTSFWKCIDKNLNSYMCINEFYDLDKCVHKIIYTGSNK